MQKTQKYWYSHTDAHTLIYSNTQMHTNPLIYKHIKYNIKQMHMNMYVHTHTETHMLKA